MSSRCQKPIMQKQQYGYMTQLPCGRCENCLKRRVSNWSFRLMQEDKHSMSSLFITLTYDIKHVPFTKRARYMDLSKRDLQLFFKRLRKLHDTHGDYKQPLKYYAVGEYGGRSFRPHYHIILFNAELPLLLGKIEVDYISRGLIKLDGKKPYHHQVWPLGHFTVGQVSEASVGYTMKYVSKPVRIPLHRNDDRTPEFSCQSNGLGLGYLTKAMVEWHKKDLATRQYCLLKDGKKVALPRYYRDKILTKLDQQELATYQMFDRLFQMEEQKEEVTAREKNEAYYAGIQRIHKQHLQNQKI